MTKDNIMDFIPGTNIPKPRTRGLDESDESYVSYLKSYYNENFPAEKVEEITKEEIIENIPKEEEPFDISKMENTDEEIIKNVLKMDEESKEEKIESENEILFKFDLEEPKQEIKPESIFNQEIIAESRNNKIDINDDIFKETMKKSEEALAKSVNEILEEKANESKVEKEISEALDKIDQVKEEKKISETIEDDDLLSLLNEVNKQTYSPEEQSFMPKYDIEEGIEVVNYVEPNKELNSKVKNHQFGMKVVNYFKNLTEKISNVFNSVVDNIEENAFSNFDKNDEWEAIPHR